MPKMKQIKVGDFTARQTTEYWDIFYKNEPIGSGDDELGIRLDNIIGPNVTQATWFNTSDLSHLCELAKKIQEYE